MGLFSFGGGDAIKDALREQRRAVNQQARLTARGIADIDFALRGYDDNYWQGRQNLYATDYLEQADETARDAYERAIKMLASRGVGTSSMADKAMADLGAAHLMARRAAANQAYDAVQGERRALEGRRAQLIGMLQSGLAPGNAAAEARAMAAQMSGDARPQPLTGLAGMFAGILQGLVPVAYAEARGFPGLGWFRPRSP